MPHDAGDPATLPYPDPLIRGRLVRRYKRFLVDVELQDGALVTAHTPNTGSMSGCSEPGSPVYLSPANKPGRKLPYTLEIIDAGPSLVGINTLLPNRIFARALAARRLRPFSGYHSVRREVAVGQSRIDLLLEGPRKGLCYVEIKNVTLAVGGAARFPDAVTERGRKHLRELLRLVRQGHRGVVLFAVQRADCSRFEPADEIDPRYGQTLRRVVAAGVEAMAWRLQVTPREVRIERRIPVRL